MAAERDLLFGLLALQNGLVDQGQLVAAFQAWTRDKGRPLSDHLVARGDLDADQRSAVDAMVALHLKKHGGDAGRSLGAIPVGRSTREGLEALGDSDVTATITGLVANAVEAEADADRTGTYSVGSSTADGQRFRVLRPHARGGLGAVFVALDAELNREVALKHILEHHADDPVSRRRFVLEAEITGGLEHPGIVPVYGLGCHADGRPYYAMRFVRGDNLKEAIERFHSDEAMRLDPGRRTLEQRSLLRRFVDVCNAIDYAHTRGVLHRDIKPGNIIVGKHGETLVVDWGLAKPMGRGESGTGGEEERTLMPASASGSSETMPGSALGTPAYMSPEQAAGELDRLGTRSDVYSLGATLYSLLTGRPPFEGEVGEVLRKVGRGDFPPPRRLDPSIDRALEAVCLKAMANAPEGRYASSRGLADDVERWMADEPVTAWREPASRRLRRWARRHRTAVAVATVAMVALVVGLSAVLAVETRAKDALDAANQQLRMAYDRERAASAEARRQTELAEKNYEVARGAVERYFVRVSESKLLNVPGLQPLRKELLETARSYYQELVDGRGGEGASKDDLANAYDKLGAIATQFGSRNDALSLHGKALELYEELARTRPDDAAPRRRLAGALRSVATLHRNAARLDDARRGFERSVRLLESIPIGATGSDSQIFALVATYNNLAQMDERSGRLDEAEAAYLRALTLCERTTDPANIGPGKKTDRYRSGLELNLANLYRLRRRNLDAERGYLRSREATARLVRADPASLEDRQDLGNCDNCLAMLYIDLHRLEEARTCLDRALATREAMARESPAVKDYQLDLAVSLMLRGDLSRLLGRQDEVRGALDRAVAILEPLARDDPDDINYALYLADTLNMRARDQLEAGAARPALRDYTTALEATERVARRSPRNPYARRFGIAALRGLCDTQARLGRYSEAVATCRRLIALGRTPGPTAPGAADLYNEACHLALLASFLGHSDAAGSRIQAREAADQAIAALRRGVAAGFADGGRMDADPDLAALHSRADYRALVVELLDRAFPADPFAMER